MKRSLVTWVVICMTLAFFVGSTSLHAQEKVIKLRYSNFFPPVHAISKLSEEWCKEIEKRTNGRVKIIYFPAIPDPAHADLRQHGERHLRYRQALLAYAPGRLPLSEVSPPARLQERLSGDKAGKCILQEVPTEGIRRCEGDVSPWRRPGLFHTRKVISSIDELKGLEDQGNAESAAIVTRWAEPPVTMPITETYDALQKGLVDGVFGPIETLKGWRFAEVVKATLETMRCPI